MEHHQTPGEHEPIVNARFESLRRRTPLLLAAILAATAALVVPFLTMAPTESASTEPDGRVFTARDLVDESFVSTISSVFFVAEHNGGDALAAEPMRQLLSAGERLRADGEIGPTLFSYFNAETGRQVNGIQSLAELLDAELESTGGLASATDAQVKQAGAALVARYGEESDVLGLSAATTADEDGNLVVPAVTLAVLADNEQLGFGNASVTLGSGTDKEEYDRSVQQVLRTAEGFGVFGVAIDVNLTSQEQGEVAGPFIGFTILAVLLIVGLTFRSYWVTATVSLALVLLVIWLKGISNLIGLKDDLVLSLVVPIAMVSFGVDFAFHAIGRYREERAEGRRAQVAIATGLAGVSGALVLALFSDVAAFLSNVSSGIESIVQFGMGAAIALVAAYLLLGIASPLTIAAIESSVPAPTPGWRSTTLRLLAGFGVAALAMTSVLLLVFILPWLGVVVAAATAMITLAIPYLVQRRRLRRADDIVAVGDMLASDTASSLAAPVGRAIAAVAGRPLLTIPAALLLTVGAASLAVQVPAEFDVEDFFSSDTDFVKGLDLIDVHVGDRGGESALVYVEADMTDPGQLAAINSALDEMRSLDTDVLARDSGEVTVTGGVFAVFDEVWASPAMASIVAQQTGVELTDNNDDGIPDTSDQIAAVLAVASEIGVPLDDQRLLLTPDNVNTLVVANASNIGDAGTGDGLGRTSFELALVNSRSQESIAEARTLLEPITADLEQELDGSFVQLTGSPFVREASLQATNDALQLSLPIALILCLIVSTTFLRSIRYGLASIVPIIMVVAWLYAFMELAGYSINLVTATIAAVSVGIGIDFAIHFIARYREELVRTGVRSHAIRIAGEGTGVALIASAISSAVGFGILALAPMPLFAAYGLLTALMIAMALFATLVVLPSVLVLVTSDTDGADQSPITVDLTPTVDQDSAFAVSG